MHRRAVGKDLSLDVARCDDLFDDLLEHGIIADLEAGQTHQTLKSRWILEELTHEKIISDFRATSVTVSAGTAPNALRGSPRESVLLVYTSGCAPVDESLFCRFLDMPRPMEPSPIQPTCDEAMFTFCYVVYSRESERSGSSKESLSMSQKCQKRSREGIHIMSASTNFSLLSRLFLSSDRSESFVLSSYYTHMMPGFGVSP